MSRLQHQRFRGVRRDQLTDPAEVLRERGRRTGRVDEQPAVPDLRGQLDQAVRPGIERVTHPWCRPDRPVELVRPTVVRADDGSAIAGLVLLKEFVAAMPAGVGEGARSVAEGHHGGDVADGHLAVRRTGGQLVDAAEAGPRPGEEVPAFPGEYG